MLLSIIIPMYNVSNYIERCLQSVFDQDIDSIVYEVILINDGSLDNSEDIARKFCEGKDNVKIIRQENKGLGGARNTGIENASGKYLLFLDADDILVNGNFEYLREADAEIIELGFIKVANSGEEISRMVPTSNSSIVSGVEYWLTNQIHPSACNKFYNRMFLLENNLKFKENIYSEDIEFNARAMFLAKCVTNKEAILQKFVQSPSSITRNTDKLKKEKMFNDLTNITLSLITFRNKYAETPKGKEFFQKIISDLGLGVINLGLKNQMKTSDIKKYISVLQNENITLFRMKYENNMKNIFKYFLFIPFGVDLVKLFYKIYNESSSNN
ncbi:MAG: glycosyltransferase [Dysgonamonadaceae bacterium]|nr:glycosyltransferase [Dysgonamonadaceae bacterium]